LEVRDASRILLATFDSSMRRISSPIEQEDSKKGSSKITDEVAGFLRIEKLKFIYLKFTKTNALTIGLFLSVTPQIR
jgi:hypothetical protein